MRDTDQNDERDEDLGEAPPAPPIEARFPLDVKKAEYTVYELHRRWEQGTLWLDPEFQREFVWSNEKQIKLVESVMARIPLPVFYLADEAENDKVVVIDGQQRLTTLFAFMEGRFADRNVPGSIRHTGEDPGRGRPFELQKLRLMKELEGKSFAHLEPKLRRKFEETQLVCFVLQSGTAPEAKFELFERINEGTTPLVPQEIRNALNRGPGLELVRELAKPGSRFRRVAGEHRTYKRMRADELVLRGIAFMWRGWEDYGGDLKLFLNESLAKFNQRSSDELRDVERRFLHAVDFASHVFGDKAWQRFDPDRKEWSGHISGPLVEVICATADRVFPNEQPSPEAASRIHEQFKALCADQGFLSAILNATQTVNNVRIRMTRFERICRDAE
jgi:hypothetical protein